MYSQCSNPNSVGPDGVRFLELLGVDHGAVEGLDEAAQGPAWRANTMHLVAV
jgi:hypothetical protein